MRMNIPVNAASLCLTIDGCGLSQIAITMKETKCDRPQVILSMPAGISWERRDLCAVAEDNLMPNKHYTSKKQI